MATVARHERNGVYNEIFTRTSYYYYYYYLFILYFTTIIYLIIMEKNNTSLTVFFYYLRRIYCQNTGVYITRLCKMKKHPK